MGSPPSPEQIHNEDPDSFSSAELDAFNSAKEKMMDVFTPPRGYLSSDQREKMAHLTGEESAAWHKYKDDLSKNWKQTEPEPDPKWDRDEQDKDYVEGKTYIDPSVDPATKPNLPDPVAGGEDGNAALVVNTDAIVTFRNNLKQLRDILSSNQSDMESMPKIKPGYFGMGGSMYRAICGDKGAPGLQVNTSEFLTSTVTAFDKLMLDIDAMVKEYKSVDDLNTLGADKLNKQFQDAFDAMSAISFTGP